MGSQKKKTATPRVKVERRDWPLYEDEVRRARLKDIETEVERHRRDIVDIRERYALVIDPGELPRHRDMVGGALLEMSKRIRDLEGEIRGMLERWGRLDTQVDQLRLRVAEESGRVSALGQIVRKVELEDED